MPDTEAIARCALRSLSKTRRLHSFDSYEPCCEDSDIEKAGKRMCACEGKRHTEHTPNEHRAAGEGEIWLCLLRKCVGT